MNTKKIGQLILAGAVVFGVFGWWAYQSFGSTNFAITLKTNKGLTVGELAHYTFDGKDINSTFNDVSGNNNNATASGFTSTTTTAGAVGQAMRWIGSNANTEWIIVPTTALPSTMISISAWFKTAKHEDWSTIISGSNWTASGSWDLYDNAAGSVIWGISNGSQNNANGANCDAINTVGKWHHVVATYNGTTGLLYEDGIQCSTPSTVSVVLDTTHYATIGSAASASSDLAIDDVRIYNRVLSPQEISRLYGLGGGASSTAQGVTIKTNQKLSGNAAGELVHYTFDGKDMINNVADVSGNGNNGLFSNGTTTLTMGPVGQALLFTNPAANNTWVTAPAAAMPTTAMSVSAWINIPQRVDWYNFVEGPSWSITNGSWLLFSDTNNGVLFGVYQGGTQNLAIGCLSALTLKKWHHAVGTYDGSITRVYLDGVQCATTGGPVSQALETAAGAVIGNTNGSLPEGMDDVRIYNRVLSIGEIQRLYGLGSTAVATTPKTNPNTTNGEVGHWTFDGKDMFNNVADVSGTGNSGTIVSATTTAFGRVGQALDFGTGKTQKITVAQATSINNIFASGGSISAWYYARTYGQGGLGFIASKQDNSISTGFTLGPCGPVCDATVNPGIEFVAYFTSGAGDWETVAGSAPINKWHHVVVTYNSSSVSNVPTIYIDGSAVSMGAVLQPIGTYNDAANNFFIGDSPLNQHLFDGLIDDVRLYSRVLSPQEVSRLYGLGK